MRLGTLIAVAVTAAFAVSPLTQAQSDKASSGTSAAPSAGSSAMDKDKDGSISREEAKGTPFEKDFSKLDKDGDGKLSASEQAEAKSGAGATGESKAPKTEKPGG